MADRLSKASFFFNMSGGQAVKVASNIAAVTTITDWDVSHAMHLAHLIATTGAPGQDTPTVQYAWQVVNTGAANTLLNGSNLNSGPWAYAGQLASRYHTHSAVGVGSSNDYYQWSCGGRNHLYFPQQPGNASDIWLTLYSDWSTIYGFTPSLLGDATVWYYDS